MIKVDIKIVSSEQDGSIATIWSGLADINLLTTDGELQSLYDDKGVFTEELWDFLCDEVESTGPNETAFLWTYIQPGTFFVEEDLEWRLGAVKE